MANFWSPLPLTKPSNRNEMFLVSTNPGLPTKPLAQVGSGGELSRISVAIQVNHQHRQNTPTMIFNEVDSGIGGGIAEIVDQKLRRLSQNCQVLCITFTENTLAHAREMMEVGKVNPSSPEYRSLFGEIKA